MKTATTLSIIASELHTQEVNSSHPLIWRASRNAQLNFANRREKLGEYRLHSTRSHYEHLEEVASLLELAGESPAVIAAGYLHDHEALLSDWTLGRLEKEFGSRVATILAWTNPPGDSLSPHLQHELNIAQVLSGPAEAISISCAEQISIVRQLNAIGQNARSAGPRLIRRWQNEVQYFKRLATVFSPRVPEVLYSLYCTELEQFEALHDEMSELLNSAEKTTLQQVFAGFLLPLNEPEPI